MFQCRQFAQVPIPLPKNHIDLGIFFLLWKDEYNNKLMEGGVTMERKLGLFTEEDMKVKSVKIQQEKENNVSAGKAGAVGAALPFWAGGAAVGAAGFAAASGV